MDPLTQALALATSIVNMTGILIDAASPDTKAQIAKQQADLMQHAIDLVTKIHDRFHGAA